uniref:Parapinopsin n=1 Tax=Geotria australis TaxID=71168 RepID=A0A1B1SKD0_9VERT|nr:parapinopsin [Geotria australis]
MSILASNTSDVAHLHGVANVSGALTPMTRVPDAEASCGGGGLAASEGHAGVNFHALSALMGITSVLSIVLNGLVIAVTLRSKLLRQPLNYALVNLACADLGISLSGGIITTVSNARGRFDLGRAVCVADGFLVAVFGMTALITVCVLAVERYVVVCKPLGGVHFNTQHGICGVAFSWAWALLWSMPPLFGWGRYHFEGVGTSCAPDWSDSSTSGRSYMTAYFTFCFTLPMLIIVFCYTKLMRAIHKVSKLGLSANDTAERKVGMMVVVMIFAFFLCWLPYAALAIATVIKPDLKVSPLTASIPVYMAKSSSAYNPIIYIFMHRQFREHISRMCCGQRNQSSRITPEENTMQRLQPA